MFAPVNLPVIDIDVLLPVARNLGGDNNDVTISEKQMRVGRQMLAALGSHGAFHCVTVRQEGNLDDAILFRTANTLLQAAQDDTQTATVKQGGFVRGFLGMGAESGGTALEVKTGFSYGHAWDPQASPRNKLQGPNVFPRNIHPDTRAKAVHFHAWCCRVAHAITRGLALALPDNTLLQECCASERDAEEAQSISLMRVFKYYPYESAGANHNAVPHVDRLGSSPHTDWGYLTLIRSTEPGLQIASTPTVTPETVWRTVEPVKNAFIVNGGDYLSVVTRGRVISPLHRVINTQNAERTSMVFFYYPPFDTRVPSDFDLTVEDKQVVDRLKHLSLFADQRDDKTKIKANSAPVLDLKTVSFGDYICSKWESVSRNY
ncbi:hypothetical protein BC830DRAFT_1079733 [Chytriomyces sp. MP71]|nr:hypothetical protein BC830DRAFT_1079733 [Chytriomyces sp. MP71]